MTFVLLVSVGLRIGPEAVRILSNSILAAVAITSLYVAYTKLNFENSHILRIDKSDEVPPRLRYTNTGKNTLTVLYSSTLYIISDKTNDENKVSLEVKHNTFNEPLEPGSKTQYFRDPVLKAGEKGHIVYSKHLFVKYLDTVKNKDNISGNSQIQTVGADYINIFDQISEVYRFFELDKEMDISHNYLDNFNLNRFMKHKIDLSWYKRYYYLARRKLII